MRRRPRFDSLQVQLSKLSMRQSLLQVGDCLPLPANQAFPVPDQLDLLCRSIQRRQPTSSVVAFMGAHLIKLGLSRFIIDLIERGIITHLATNGAGLIHDFELALAGETSEDVARWIQLGQFGLWQETSKLNDIFGESVSRDEGFGEAVGRAIEEETFPYRDISIAAACWRKQIPCTCHISIGSDITHAMPNFDAAAVGQASYTDFLIFTHTVSCLDGGVFLNIGSAVTGPEVFLKALSMARNVAHRQGKKIQNFTTGVFDLVPLPKDYAKGPPMKDDPLYYFRPWKTLLCRTLAGSGESYYIGGDVRETIPVFWQALVHSRRSEL